MNKRLLSVSLALGIFAVPQRSGAQFSDPRTYDNAPVGINQVELSYAYVHGNASIDTSLVVTGARFDLNQGTIDYTHYFGALHRLMWAEAAVPLAALAGSIAGTNIEGSATGAGDSSYGLGILLKGGPGLRVSEFETYKPRTVLGVSLTVTAPSGVYRSNKILNLGSDRWSFKPEIALSHPFGPGQKWEIDAYANAFFYTDNDGREILGQQPLPGLEGHLSYSFSTAFGLLLIPVTHFAGRRFSTASLKTMPSRI